MGRPIIPRPADATPIPESAPGNPSNKIDGAKEQFKQIGEQGHAFGHFDDALGEAVRALLGAVGQKVPEVQAGTEVTRYSINPQQLADFANACGSFEECDDDVGEAVRRLYGIVDRILLPT